MLLSRSYTIGGFEFLSKAGLSDFGFFVPLGSKLTTNFGLLQF
jgi:hypothetical protein